MKINQKEFLYAKRDERCDDDSVIGYESHEKCACFFSVYAHCKQSSCFFMFFLL